MLYEAKITQLSLSKGRCVIFLVGYCSHYQVTATDFLGNRSITLLKDFNQVLKLFLLNLQKKIC